MADNAAVKAKVSAYLLLQQEIKDAKLAQERLKEELAPYLDNAEPNVRGSLVIPFEEMLEVNGQRYKGLQRVRKESTVLNEERALAFLLKDQAFEAAIVTVHHVDMDALWDYYVNDLIDKETYDSFFDTTVSWSFLPTKE